MHHKNNMGFKCSIYNPDHNKMSIFQNISSNVNNSGHKCDHPALSSLIFRTQLLTLQAQHWALQAQPLALQAQHLAPQAQLPARTEHCTAKR